MKPDTSKFKELVEAADRILITSHISPDPDAVSSLLLVGSTLKENYPHKQVRMVFEEEPVDLDFLPGYSFIEFQPLAAVVKDFKPELFILIDGNNYNRVSRHDGDALRSTIKQNNVKSIIIDHHEPVGKDEVDLYINRGAAASVQEAYQLLFKDFSFSKPAGFAEVALVGLYADTGGFVYVRPNNQEQVFDLVKELVSAGANIEQTDNRLTSYSEDDIRALGNLAANIGHQDDYSFSFLEDAFIAQWLKEGHSQAQLQRATGAFLDGYIRNVDNRKWGFIVYKNTLQGENMYSVSFRAVSDAKDVSAIAHRLGGGGHKPAAGAKFEAANIQEAISKVNQAINATV
jgi:phosphoesterase RecJ-like protein